MKAIKDHQWSGSVRNLTRLSLLSVAVCLTSTARLQAQDSFDRPAPRAIIVDDRPPSASVVPMRQSFAAASGPFLDYNGRYAYALPGMPPAVHKVVSAANQLQSKPYVWGGGHRVLYDRGYDCSGSVSYVLYHGGLVPGPLSSRDFARYGEPGPGRYITIYVRNGHVFMSVCGLRFDTSNMSSRSGEGPKWRPSSRSLAGYTMRHPRGL